MAKMELFIQIAPLRHVPNLAEVHVPLTHVHTEESMVLLSGPCPFLWPSYAFFWTIICISQAFSMPASRIGI